MTIRGILKRAASLLGSLCSACRNCQFALLFEMVLFVALVLGLGACSSDSTTLHQEDVSSAASSAEETLVWKIPCDEAKWLSNAALGYEVWGQLFSAVLSSDDDETRALYGAGHGIQDTAQWAFLPQDAVAIACMVYRDEIKTFVRSVRKCLTASKDDGSSYASAIFEMLQDQKLFLLLHEYGVGLEGHYGYIVLDRETWSSEQAWTVTYYDMAQKSILKAVSDFYVDALLKGPNERDLSTLPPGVNVWSPLYVPEVGLYIRISIYLDGIIPGVSSEDLEELSQWTCEDWIVALNEGFLDPGLAFLETLPDDEALYIELYGETIRNRLFFVLDQSSRDPRSKWILFDGPAR